MRISITQARKQFGNVCALDGIDLDIRDGELFFLLGPSGCGKTTLLRALAGFQELDSGRIAFGDRDMTGVPTHQRGTGMMFQGYALWPHMSVAENVAFGLEMRGLGKAEREQRTRTALERVKIAELASRKPHQLSGGQQQRVALARTLVIEPSVLLLDEPLANLDAKLRLEMRREIRQLCKDTGLTAVYVTHDQKEALSVADRLAIMRQGRLLQVGTPQDVYQRPVSAYVAEFIGETNLLPATVTGLETGAVTRLQLATACGTLCAELPAGSAAANFAPGRSVTLSIRPEACRLLPAGAVPAAAGCNHIPVQVTDVMYLGGSSQYQLRSTDGTLFTALEMNPSSPAPAVNTPAILAIAAADIVVAE